MTEEMLKELENARKEGKSIGLVQGSWDLFHLGHLKYLKEARKRCDYLVVGIDSDEKIKARKGIKRPIIPYVERSEFISLLGLADVIVEKGPKEPKWGLIKQVKPDVLVAIQENYTEDDLVKLEEYCGKVDILPKQSTNSTSDIIRKTLIVNGVKIPNKNNPLIDEGIERIKENIGYSDDMAEPIPELIRALKKSTDTKQQVAACCKIDGKWRFGVNQTDQSLSPQDIEERSELFYSTVEHAEINLLKQLGFMDNIESPVYTTLFPCDKCMKVLINKGVKEIYYIEDHSDKNWSKRSHALAESKGVKTIKLLDLEKTKDEEVEEFTPVFMKPEEYKFIDPRNVRDAEQLQIMIAKEEAKKDPLDPNVIDQDILFTTDYWYVTRNKFPIKQIEEQFLIVSLDPIYDIQDMPKQMWVDLKKIWDRLRTEYNLPGGSLCHRFGDTGRSGATLKRVHAHIVVPKKDLKSKFTIGGNSEVKHEIMENYKRLVLTPPKEDTNE